MPKLKPNRGTDCPACEEEIVLKQNGRLLNMSDVKYKSMQEIAQKHVTNKNACDILRNMSDADLSTIAGVVINYKHLVTCYVRTEDQNEPEMDVVDAFMGMMI